MPTRTSRLRAESSAAAFTPNWARHVPCLLQDNVARSIIQIAERDRLAGTGSVTAVSGDSFSGKTTILSRLGESRALKRKVRSLDLSSFFVFESLRQSISDSFKLSFSDYDWPNAVTIPGALQRYILLSGVRVFAVDDAQQWLHMGVDVKSDFLSLLAGLVAPPLNMSLILSGLPAVMQAETIAEVCNSKLVKLTIGSWRYSEEYLRFLSSVELSAKALYMIKTEKPRLIEGNVPLLILQLSEGQTGSIISNVRTLVAKGARDPDFHLTDETVMQTLVSNWEF